MHGVVKASWCILGTISNSVLLKRVWWEVVADESGEVGEGQVVKGFEYYTSG